MLFVGLLKIERREGDMYTGTIDRSTRLIEFTLLATQKNSQLILALLWRTRKAVRRDMYVSGENIKLVGPMKCVNHGKPKRFHPLI
jgi:hypothetical protein